MAEFWNPTRLVEVVRDCLDTRRQPGAICLMSNQSAHPLTVPEQRPDHRTAGIPGRTRHQNHGRPFRSAVHAGVSRWPAMIK